MSSKAVNVKNVHIQINRKLDIGKQIITDP